MNEEEKREYTLNYLANKMSPETEEFLRLKKKAFKAKKISKEEYDMFLDDYVQRMENFAEFAECEDIFYENLDTLKILVEDGSLKKEDQKSLEKELTKVARLRDKMGEFESLLFDSNPNYLEAFLQEYADRLCGFECLVELYAKRYKEQQKCPKNTDDLKSFMREQEKIAAVLRCGDEVQQFQKNITRYYNAFVEPQMNKAKYLLLCGNKKIEEMNALAQEINKERLQAKSLQAAKALGLSKKEVLEDIKNTQRILADYEKVFSYCASANKALIETYEKTLRPQERSITKKSSSIFSKVRKDVSVNNSIFSVQAR